MGTLWLYAIPLDDVRDFFAAPDSLAADLLARAADVAHDQVKPPLIGKVGPLMRHPIQPLIDLPGPSIDDAHAMIEGRALPPNRLGPAWVIVRHWCAVYCCDSTQVEVSRDQLATLDFEHVAAGMGSQYSFGTVLSRDPHLPLLPAPGLVIGWMPNRDAQRVAVEWGPATGQGEGASPITDQSAEFSREDHTRVGLTWPLRDAQPPDDWDGELNGFFERAAQWAVAPTGFRTTLPDILAMYQ